MTDVTIRYDYDDGRPSKVVTLDLPDNVGGLLHDSAWYDALIDAFDDGSDWTTDPKIGGSNNSEQFYRLVTVVRALIRGGGASMCLSDDWCWTTARTIVAQLAHVHHMVPLPVKIEYDGTAE